MNSQPIQYIADQVRKTWLRSQSPDMVDRAFRLVGAANAVEVIYIVEFGSGNWDAAVCTGQPMMIWAYRGEQFQELEALGDLDLMNPIASRTPVISYCRATDGQRMIHLIWNGPRAGYGQILRRIDDGWQSEGRRWTS